MELFIDILLDALIDTVKLIPFLYVTYFAMEWLEHAASGRSEEAIRRAGAAGPVIGALLGAVPQCGFSAAASTLYAGRVITLGTLFAVYLSTSDEMLPIFLAEGVEPLLIAQIIGLKVLVGLVMGFAIDAGMRLARRGGDGHLHIHELCEQEGCECDHEAHAHDHADGRTPWGGIALSALRHTAQVTVFIFLITLVLGAAIELVGEEALAAAMAGNPVLSVVAAATVGLIPNCGASVVITELFLEGTIGAPAAMAGLLVGAGVGLLVLLRTNHRPAENARIAGMLWAIGVCWGLVFQAIGLVL